MRKLLFGMPTTFAVVTASMIFATQPVAAAPDCVLETRLRCMGYSVQGRPPLNDRYDSFEECYVSEAFARCGVVVDPLAALESRVEDVAFG